MELNGLIKSITISIIFSALYFTTFYVDNILNGTQGLNNVIDNMYDVNESLQVYNYAALQYNSFYFIIHGLLLFLGIILIFIAIYSFAISIYLFKDMENATAVIRIIYGFVFLILASMILYFNTKIASVYNNTYFYQIEENGELNKYINGKLLENMIYDENNNWIIDLNSKLAFNIKFLTILMHCGFAISLSTLLLDWYIIDDFLDLLETMWERIWWIISFEWIRELKYSKYYENNNLNSFEIKDIEWRDITIETESVSETYLQNIILSSGDTTKNYFQSIKIEEQYLLEIKNSVFKTKFIPMYISYNELKSLFPSINKFNFSVLAAAFYRFINICTRNLSKYIKGYNKEYKLDLQNNSHFLYSLKQLSSKLLQDFLKDIANKCKTSNLQKSIYQIETILNNGEYYYDDFNEALIELLDEIIENINMADFEDEKDFVFNDELSDLDLAFDFFGLTKDDKYDSYKKKYRELAKKYHPDSNNYNESFENKINLLNKHKMILDKYYRG